jgi:hypothetical protein
MSESRTYNMRPMLEATPLLGEDMEHAVKALRYAANYSNADDP